MVSSRLPDAATRRLTHNLVKHYAICKGWVEKTYQPGRASVIACGRGSHLREFLLPLDPKLSDYRARLVDAVYQLSTRERRLPLQVVSDILAGGMDVLRVRVGGRGTAGGSIPLLAAEDLYEGAKKMLLASAQTVLTPSIVHSVNPRVQVERFLESCRCGQTEVGSYVARFLCPMQVAKDCDPGEPLHPEIPGLFPVEEHGAPASLPSENACESVPFGRRVTVQLMRSVELIADCAKREDPSVLLSQPADNAKVSVNFCEAVGLLEPSGLDGYLSLDMAYIGSAPTTKHTQECIRLKKSTFEMLEFVASALRPRPVREEQFVGRITGLWTKERSALSLFAERPLAADEIEISLLLEDGRVQKARASLQAEDHRRACDAYRDSSVVKISGVLSLRTKPARFTRVDALSIP